MKKAFFTATLLLLATFTLHSQSVTESERKIPIAYDVDVIVIGGTTRGVAAAEAAAKSGVSVFLAAPRPYLGEDMCATYRLWLEDGEIPTTDLGKAIFAPQQKQGNTGLKFTYKADKPSSLSHRDSKNPSLLRDGKFSSAATESVQYDDNVSIIADLGTSKDFSGVYALTYQRPDDFAVDNMTVYTSDDKKNWTKFKTVPNTDIRSKEESNPRELAAEGNLKARYVRLDFEIAKGSKRILIGEIIIQGKNDASQAVKFNKVTTPQNIKLALDKALLKAKVNYLYGSYITDILEDEQGKPSGIIITNRSGRQAVKGKVLIDATARGVAARLAGAKFTEYPAGKQKFKRIVLNGEARKNAKDLGFTYNATSHRLSYKVYEYDLEINMKDGSWASFAKADEEARNLTWQTGQTASSEELFQIPPDNLISRAASGNWKSSEDFSIDSLKPKNIDYFYVLGGCADISREAAGKLLRPLNGIALGHRLGGIAAKQAKERSVKGVLSVKAQIADSKVIKADIGEMLHGLRSRPEFDKQKYVTSTARNLPVIARFDTVVIGGGTGGAPAGVGAARGGARVLVVEYLHGLGGVGTLGRISKYYHGNRVGFTSEVDKGVVSLGGENNSRKGWNIENKMEWLRSEIVKAGGDVWFQCLGAGSVVRNNKFIGAVVVTPHGRGIVLANTVIDSTGNAVIPACAGLKTQEITGEHISVQGTGLPQYTPGESYKNSDWTFTDDDDVLDMWRIHVVGRQKYAKAFDQGQLIDTRARRRIVGDITVSPMDIINKRVYPDIITVSKSNFDNHGFSSHSLFMITPPDKKGLTGNVPYRALLPKDYDGILVTGLGMSAHGDAMPVMRMQPDVQNQGYAAGKASAMAAENGSTVRKVNIPELQKHLVDMKIIPESLVDAKDTYPVSLETMDTAVKAIGKDYKGIALVLTDPEKALPLLRKAWQDADSEDAKVRYAHVLGMMFDDTGAESLIKAVSNAKWDKGWNFRGMGQFGATTSHVDNLVIALGRTKSKSGLSAILKKLKELTPKSEFSHSRAVSIAFETLKDKTAARPLAEFLQKEGIMGHSFLEINNVIKRTPASTVDNSTRNNSLRELILARALYRCGDYNGLGEKILNDYAKDYRGHYSSHAKAVLKEGK